MTTVVAVVGTIPGAGATTAVATLGAALAERSQRVALVDATREGSRLAEIVRTDGGGELGDALRRGTTLAEVQADGPRGVAVFPADGDTSWGSMRPDAVADAYATMRDRFDVVLVDCGSTLSPAGAPWLGHADDAIVVTDPDVAGAVEETAALARAFDVEVIGIVANRVPPKEVSTALAALDSTGLRVLAVLPEDRAVGEAAAEGTSVFVHDPDSVVARVAWRFADALLSGDHEEPTVPQGTLAVAGGAPAGEPAGGAPDADAGGPSGAGAGGSGVDGAGSSAEGESGDARGSGGSPGSETVASAPDGPSSPEQPTGTAVGDPDGSERSRDGATATDRGDGPDADRRAQGGGPAGDHERTISQILSGAGEDAGRDAGEDEAGAVDEPDARPGENRDASGDDRGPDRFEFGPTERGESGPDGEDAELSDEEIEAVFERTRERVERRREREDDEE